MDYFLSIYYFREKKLRHLNRTKNVNVNLIILLLYIFAKSINISKYFTYNKWFKKLQIMQVYFCQPIII